MALVQVRTWQWWTTCRAVMVELSVIRVYVWCTQLRTNHKIRISDHISGHLRASQGIGFVRLGRNNRSGSTELVATAEYNARKMIWYGERQQATQQRVVHALRSDWMQKGTCGRNRAKFNFHYILTVTNLIVTTNNHLHTFLFHSLRSHFPVTNNFVSLSFTIHLHFLTMHEAVTSSFSATPGADDGPLVTEAYVCPSKVSIPHHTTPAPYHPINVSNGYFSSSYRENHMNFVRSHFLPSPRRWSRSSSRCVRYATPISTCVTMTGGMQTILW